jgi:hypothetical protein
MAEVWLEWVEMVWLVVEFKWNGGRLAGGILILGTELGLDMLKWGVGRGKRVETVENASKCVRGDPARRVGCQG